MSEPEISTLEGMQRSYLEALRHREQEIFKYLAILGPAVGGFFWMLYKGTNLIVTVGTIGVQLLLLLGSVYSIAISYNYRYIILQLAKLEAHLNLKDVTLVGWPRCKKDFIDHCNRCEPPEIIKVFWWAFLISIVFASVIACIKESDKPILLLLIAVAGSFSLSFAFLIRCRFGKKLRMLYAEEPDSWM